MQFQVVKAVPPDTSTGAFLERDEWDDFFFRTSFTLVLFTPDSGRIDIGPVKIGRLGMQPKLGRAARPELPASFETLGDDYFSLGQGEDYYQSLNTLPDGMRDAVLQALRDCARDLTIFSAVIEEPVMQTSLLRFINADTVRGRLHRLAFGMAELTPFDFSYDLPGSACFLAFNVVPNTQPPTNVHALIGRNGVGKTRCLRGMSRCLVLELNDPILDGVFTDGKQFANLISVAFSAFDPVDAISTLTPRVQALPYVYIGLKTLPNPATSLGKPQPPEAGPTKSVEDLALEFSNSVSKCRSGLKAQRLRRALTTLSADPVFKAAQVLQLLTTAPAKPDAKALFNRLSSGHKIVLLTVTRLVETVEEASLILIDEPEGHLHPPLGAAFVRCLSDLLIERNAVAIIATHSPVVLQEIPRSCVWVMSRSGENVHAERPRIESFGENVGVLTSEVFGLEVSESGFNQILARLCEHLD
jgi:ABC-type cobalamin/Fe3+-siderophores transport system ATPase subunit